MSKAYFIINIKARKFNGRIKVSTIGRGSKIYSVRNILWTKKPYFVMQKKSQEVQGINPETIKKLL